MPKSLERTTGLAEAHHSAIVNSCAFIMIGHGQFTLVDVCDVAALSNYHWHSDGAGYVKAKIYGKSIRLHTFLMRTPAGCEVDHINRNRKDNRRCNLRICTPSQNKANTIRRSHNKASQYKGVRRNPSGTFSARGILHGVEIGLGTFKTEQAAAAAYNSWAVGAFGDFARTNHLQ